MKADANQILRQYGVDALRETVDAGSIYSPDKMAAEEAIASLPTRLARVPRDSRLSLIQNFVTNELRPHVEHLIADQATTDIVEIARTHGVCSGGEAEVQIERLISEAFATREPEEPPQVKGPEDFETPAERRGDLQDDVGESSPGRHRPLARTRSNCACRTAPVLQKRTSSSRSRPSNSFPKMRNR